MDEVHNLVRPSAEILRAPRRLQNLINLRQLLRTAENSVVIGFTGTPLCDSTKDADLLKALIKGPFKDLNDEGFLSFYMGAPSSVFPTVLPRGLPSAIPALAIRPVILRNFMSQTKVHSGRKKRNETYKVKGGNRFEYLRKHNEALFLPKARKGPHATMRDVDSDMDLASLSRLCSLGQACNFAARADVASIVHGSPGRTCTSTWPSAHAPKCAARVGTPPSCRLSLRTSRAIAARR